MSFIVPRRFFSVTMFQVPAFQSRAFDAIGFRFYTCVKRARLEAERIQQLQNEANQAHIEQLRKENQEQADIANRAKLDAEKAAKIEQHEKLKQQYYKEGKFHLVIARIPGTGKSTLINAFRGIWDGEEKTAATDVVESTSAVTAYPDPISSGLTFRGQEHSRWYNIPTYIVRSKSDIHVQIHVQNLVQKTRRVPGARRDPDAKVLDDACKEYMTKTRDSVRTNLMKTDPPLRSQRMYVVSRDALTLMIREEPLEDSLVLDEHESWKDTLQDAFSRTIREVVRLDGGVNEESWFWTPRAAPVVFGFGYNPVLTLWYIRTVIDPLFLVPCTSSVSFSLDEKHELDFV
ncbi:hypothetical protein ARMGADRAFT_1022641 [Armillaria gallica]|uniref:G domain-containing protein n=1 Tax=Armillaria gallica TaxID=47427 RepID=A0A2H3ED35_ARMGA|nr:hypothetical protein ARMGADRAFT_1022641 [Armillaria gallica]